MQSGDFARAGWIREHLHLIADSERRALVEPFRGDWYTKPSDFYRKKPLVDREEAFKQGGGRVLTSPDGKKNRGQFYLYLRQNGLWTRQVTGFDPEKESAESWTPERVIRRMREMIGGVEAESVAFDLHSTYTYTIAASVADRLRDGRLLLIGDAAHRIPPAAHAHIPMFALTFRIDR